MNVTLDDVGPCKKLLRFELGEAEVNEAFLEAEKEYQKHANLPGFRKGKAPKDIVLKTFAKEIKEEAQRRLISDSYRKAIKEQNLNVFNLLNVEEGEVERNKPMQFVATVEVQPQFELPPYRGLRALREDRHVTEQDIDHAIDLLRQRHATFNTVDREVRQGDIAVVNYTGTCEGQPIAEVAPGSKGLAAQQNFWIEIKEGAFIPGFTEQLVGAAASAKRTVNVDFPADFVAPTLAGKKGVYEVEVIEVKERVLPPLDEAFAKAWEATDVNSLREGVRQDLQNELNTKQSRRVRDQVVRNLLNQVNFEPPESAVLAETRNVVYDIVRENQQRGISKEAIEQSKDDIYNAATGAARERMKAMFIFQKIAEKEGIKVEPHEFHARLFTMAKSMQMTPDRLTKELEKRNGIPQIYEQILNDKVIDFLQQHAKVEDVPAGQLPT